MWLLQMNKLLLLLLGQADCGELSLAQGVNK
jgi:hypothetical protein